MAYICIEKLKKINEVQNFIQISNKSETLE